MRILFTLIHFDLITGASMNVYELSRVLAARGHDVTVTAPTVGGEPTRRARANGVRVVALADLRASPFDVVHANQTEPSALVLALLPGVPAVATIHSLGLLDRPLRSRRVRAHACVRPEIRDRLVRAGAVEPERALVVPNAIDLARFRAVESPPARARKRVLFVGTVSPIRRAASLDLIARSRAEGFDVRFVGLRADGYLDRLPASATFAEGERWHVEEELAAADETAGIFVGRTTVEGWACGRPALVYEVDMDGRVRSVAFRPPPPPDELAEYDAERVAARYEELYEAAAGDSVSPHPSKPGAR